MQKDVSSASYLEMSASSCQDGPSSVRRGCALAIALLRPGRRHPGSVFFFHVYDLPSYPHPHDPPPPPHHHHHQHHHGVITVIQWSSMIHIPVFGCTAKATGPHLVPNILTCLASRREFGARHRVAWVVASESTYYKSGRLVWKRTWIWNQESSSVANNDEKTASKLSTNTIESDQDHSILKLWSIYVLYCASTTSSSAWRRAVMWRMRSLPLKMDFHCVVSNSSNSGFLWSPNTSKELQSRRWIEKVSYKASWSFAC